MVQTASVCSAERRWRVIYGMSVFSNQTEVMCEIQDCEDSENINQIGNGRVLEDGPVDVESCN